MVRADTSPGIQTPSSPSKTPSLPAPFSTGLSLNHAFLAAGSQPFHTKLLHKERASGLPCTRAEMRSTRRGRPGHVRARAEAPRGAELGGRAEPQPEAGAQGRAAAARGNGRLLVVRSRRLFAHFLLTAIRQGDGAAPTQPGRSQNSPETSPLLPTPVCRPRPGHGQCGEVRGGNGEGG